MPEQIINGSRIHYMEQGSGRPLVLVHGFPLDSRIWEAQVAGLADQWRVIALDLPGFGRSLAERPFTIESLADDLHAFLGRIGALPCVLGGLSMGGYVSFAFLTKHPHELTGLILVDTKCEADTPEAKANRMKMIEACRAGGAKAVAEQMEPKMLAPATLRNRPEVVARLRSIMEACPPRTIEYALLAMRERSDYRDKLASIAVPVLGLFGEHDAITTPTSAQAMCGEIPHARLLVIPGAGHMAPMEQPEAVNDAIRQFLRG